MTAVDADMKCYLCSGDLVRTKREDPGDEFTFCPHCDRTKGCPPKWRDNYGPAIDLDPRPPLSDELQVCDPLPVILDDEDGWRAPGYL